MVVRQMCVDLRRRDVGVTEQRLNAPQIGAALQQMRRERMTQLVRRARLLDPRRARVRAEELPHTLPRERPAARRQEQHRRRARLRVLRANGEVRIDRREARLAERNKAALPALSKGKNEPLTPLDVRQAEPDELAHAQPSRVENVQHRPIAEPSKRSGVRPVQQPPDLLDVQHLGEAAPDLWAIHERARIDLHHPLAQEKTRKAADSREVTGRRPRPQTCAAELDKERRDNNGRERARIKRALLLGVLAELREIPRVRLDRLGRERPLHAEVIQERVHPAGEVHDQERTSIDLDGPRKPLARAAGIRYNKCPVIHEAPFEVVEPQAAESPVVVEVPHAGLRVDPEALTLIAAPARCIARDADLHVDALFQDAPREGATLLYARQSRYVVDLNRAEVDCDADAVEGAGRSPHPRGVIWRLSTDGDPILTARLSRAEFERRLDAIYRPYHATLAALLSRKKAKFGFVILVCAHSMPTQGRRGNVELGSWRADLVPGTRGRTTAAGALIDRVDDHGRSFGWTVVHDDPYRGGYSTGHYGEPTKRAHAIQLEIARRLYMDEERLRIHPEGFQTVREFARTLVARLAVSNEDVLVGSSRRASAPERRG